MKCSMKLVAAGLLSTVAFAVRLDEDQPPHQPTPRDNGSNPVDPVPLELKQAESEWDMERKMEEQAALGAAQAVEAEKKAEAERQKATSEAAAARAVENEAAKTREYAAHRATVAAGKHQASEVADAKSNAAKDAIAYAARLAAQTMAEKSQFDKEETEAGAQRGHAAEAAGTADTMTKTATAAKEAWTKQAAEAAQARQDAFHSVEDSKAAKAIAMKMQQQATDAAEQNLETRALRAKEAEAGMYKAKAEATRAAAAVSLEAGQNVPTGRDVDAGNGTAGTTPAASLVQETTAAAATTAAATTAAATTAAAAPPAAPAAAASASASSSSTLDKAKATIGSWLR